VTIDSFGLWTLKRLGYGPIAFPVSGPLRLPEIPGYERRGVSRWYLLPNKARQGPRTWYLIHLHFRIVFSPKTRSGRAYVTASTGAPSDLRASAQIIFKVERRGGKLWISSDSLGLVAGHRVREAPSRRWTLAFDNYVPYAGVKPGRNELEFGLEQTNGVRIRSLRFFSDSGIRYSPYSPAQVTLSARSSPRRVRLGHPLTVVATIRNTGGRGIGNALVLVDYSRSDFKPRGADSKRLRLPGKSNVRASFSFEPVRTGDFEVDLEARAALSNPVIPLRIRVTGRRHGDALGLGVRWLALGAAAAATLALLIFATVKRRNRKRSVD
jgi:hypothetical protein